MEPYRSLYPYNVYRLPQTEELVRRVLVLPTGTAIHPHEIEAIASVVRLVLTNPEECRDLLAIERQNKGLIAAKAGQSTATAAS